MDYSCLPPLDSNSVEATGSLTEGDHESFRQAIGGNPVTILTFREMVIEIQGQLTTTLVAATEVGIILQLFSAADMKVADK